MPARGWEVGLSLAGSKGCTGAAGRGRKGTRARVQKPGLTLGTVSSQQGQARGAGNLRAQAPVRKSRSQNVNPRLSTTFP